MNLYVRVIHCFSISPPRDVTFTHVIEKNFNIPFRRRLTLVLLIQWNYIQHSIVLRMMVCFGPLIRTQLGKIHFWQKEIMEI
jgi:hypothetical protein